MPSFKSLTASMATFLLSTAATAAPITWDYAFDTPVVGGASSIAEALLNASVNGVLSGRLSFDTDDFIDFSPQSQYYFVEAHNLTHTGTLTDWFNVGRGLYVWKDSLGIAKWFYPELLSDPSYSLDIEFDRSTFTVLSGYFSHQAAYEMTNLRFEQVYPNAIPEPGTLTLLLAGMAGLALTHRRRKL